MKPIRIALLTAFTALMLAAQTPAADAITSLETALKSVVPTAATAAPVPVAAERPNAWIGAGAVYDPNTKKTTGWATWARLIDAKSGTYFFTTEDAMPVRGATLLDTKIQTSVRVGIGTILKEYGRFKLIGLCDGGGATIGSASSGAASCGSLGAFRASTHWTIIAGFRVIKTALVGGTPKQYEIGIGRDWGK